MKCVECKEEDVRIWNMQLDSQKRKIYVNEEGKRWNGFVCPQCKCSTDVRGKKVKTKRNCRSCGKVLDIKHYFRCFKCSETALSLENADSYDKYDWGYEVIL